MDGAENRSVRRKTPARATATELTNFLTIGSAPSGHSVTEAITKE